ncbi:unnamed protein product [Porites evermanni]|uniref:Uncharacterized protein n=1 Tax=Porites evermanni TaxID=104178 RepID=A0ABN8RJF6_9CNID|nr:unnamed protein product [Porites evermanni]
MVVLIRNLQKRIVLNIPLILQNANTLVDILRINHFDVNLVFVGKGFIKSLNLRYRRRNVTTDVLAFPYLQQRFSRFQNLDFLTWGRYHCSFHQLPKPGVLPQMPLKPHEYTLGDIVLGTHKINEDCESDGIELDTYLPVIITHGLCHLLGYTHETQDELDKMRNKEVEVLKEFNRRTGFNSVLVTPEKVELFRIPKTPQEKKGIDVSLVEE